MQEIRSKWAKYQINTDIIGCWNIVYSPSRHIYFIKIKTFTKRFDSLQLHFCMVIYNFCVIVEIIFFLFLQPLIFVVIIYCNSFCFSCHIWRYFIWLLCFHYLSVFGLKVIINTTINTFLGNSIIQRVIKKTLK